MLLFPFHDSMTIGTHHIAFFSFLKGRLETDRTATKIETFEIGIPVMEIQNPGIRAATPYTSAITPGLS